MESVDRGEIFVLVLVFLLQLALFQLHLAHLFY
jgi:hypothetical protein